MKTRLLRDIKVSEVGMGCMAFSHGYGKIPPEEYSIAAIRNAYEHGCTLFDTAEVYSPNLSGIGHNELDNRRNAEDLCGKKGGDSCADFPCVDALQISKCCADPRIQE